MNEPNILNAYKSITALLEKHRLKEAHVQLKALLDNGSDYALQSRLEQAETAYRYMLQYMRQGSKDPGRHNLYLQLCAETWEIADQAYLLQMDNSLTGNYYHTLRRTRKLLAPQSLEERLHILEAFEEDMSLCQLVPNDRKMLDEALARHENTNLNLFLDTWANSGWNADEDRQADGFLHSEELPANDLCLFVSAVTLSLQACFDPRKLKWLMDASQVGQSQAAQRALVGMVLTLHRHPQRLPLYPPLVAQLSMMNEDGKLANTLNRIYIQLLRSQDTENVNRKMREEIIPGMIKNVEMIRNLKFGFEELSEDNDLNPDWEKALEDTGFNEKIRQMNELQMEGSDVHMSTFAQLKHFPFFRETGNWLYPFDTRHSSVIHEFAHTDTGTANPLLVILQSGFFCDSDKYSMVFMLNHLPASQRNMVFHQITSQDMGELVDNGQLGEMKKYAERPEVISNQYIHDLYRFFKLSPHHNDLHDIFGDEIALHRLPVIGEWLSAPELLKKTADFHFRKEHYDEALGIYQELCTSGHADADLFQKTGYCLQKGKRYREAVNAYLKADILKTDHLWTIRHLATCYRQGREYEKALEYYRKAETIQPENRNVLFHTGICLAELKRYDEALQYFFRIDLMDGNDIKTWRAIAWCSFVNGKTEQAEKYYAKILNTPSPLATDYLNAGHVAWKKGNLPQAISYYSEAARSCKDRNMFATMFEKDREVLAEMGMPVEDIPLIMDLTE